MSLYKIATRIKIIMLNASTLYYDIFISENLNHPCPSGYQYRDGGLMHHVIDEFPGLQSIDKCGSKCNENESCMAFLWWDYPRDCYLLSKPSVDRPSYGDDIFCVKTESIRN